MDNFKLVLDFMDMYKKLNENERIEIKKEAPEGMLRVIDIIDDMISKEKSKMIPIYYMPMVSDERWNELTRQQSSR